MKLISIIFSVLICVSCGKEKPSKVKEERKHTMFSNFSVILTKEKKHKKNEQIQLLATFFRANWNYDDYECLLLKKPGIENFKDPFRYLTYDMTSKIYSVSRPTLLSLTDVSETQTLAKVAFQHPTGNGFAALAFIYNFLIVKANGEYKLTSPLNYNTKNWKKLAFGNIQYIAPPHHQFDERKMQKMEHFNKEIAAYFQVNPVKFKYYVCENFNQISQLRGYDFKNGMFRDFPYNSIALSRSNIIFASRNSEYNFHELIHLYEGEYFMQTHSIISEGVATYFGGSAFLPFKDHIQELKNHLKAHPINLYHELLINDNSYIINDKTSLKYTLGALLCDLALKKHEKQGLIALLDSGKSNEDLMQTLETLFGIDQSNFNEFIERELQYYE